MRRRVLVFFSVFLLCAVLSLTYTYMRPAVYSASARIQVMPSEKVPTVGGASSAAAPARSDNPQALLVELQILNSRPLLEKVVKRLQDQGELRGLGADPVLAVQEMLTVTRVQDTNVVQLEAQGPERALLTRLINAVIDVYREEQAATGTTTAQTDLDQAREEAKVIESRLGEKKRAVEGFRLRSDIVSAERDENQTLSRLKGLGTSLSTATEREAVAEGKARAIEQAIAQNKSAPQLKVNPTVSAIEQRLSQMREEWRALERQFTPQYLEMDPNAKAMKIRITNLEQQLETERVKGQQGALAEAREEAAGARATTQRLQQQLADDRQTVQAFSRRFSEFKGMQEELQGLEQMRQAARQKVLALEATEGTRKPRVLVVEPAAAPDTPLKPLYTRDAAISVAASLLLGFLAVWFVEFFNRTEAAPVGPTTVIMPQPWMAVPYPAAPGLPGMAPAAGPALTSSAQDPQLLLRSAPRELLPSEVQGLLRAAAPENLAALIYLLYGLTGPELIALKVEDVDTAARNLRVPGDAGRALPLPRPLLELLGTLAPASGTAPLFPNAKGQPMDGEDLASIVTSSAYDGHLEQPASITPEVLRYTYVAFLVRQGVRFSDLSRVVGRVSTETLSALATLAPGAERVPLDQVERLLPAVRALQSDPQAAQA
ncbi:MAG TPA: Wzz/FepE/Etk N-terminal domain-containing protein [Burkholderiaceae bacterium]|nr:Wzz/FepE/Etk N-terminal domain-containing protein [Burkholderiaceae bacterium]